MLYKFFLQKSCSLWENMKIYNKALLASNDNIVHAHIMLDNRCYKQKLGMCKIFFDFSYATTVLERTSILRFTYIVSLLLNLVLGLARHI